MFEPSAVHSELDVREIEDDAFVVVSHGGKSLLGDSSIGYRLPTMGDVRGNLDAYNVLLTCGRLDGRPVYGIELSSEPDGSELPEKYVFQSARCVFLQGNMDLIAAVCRARELVLWRNSHRYCGRCTRALHFSERDLALVCGCGTRYYPQIAPAVIVAVSRNEGQELLLAHNGRFEDGIYSLLAGFVEAGETLEQAIAREIREESGIEVKNIQYLCSQPWPFPNSLMLAFSAEYAGGEAKPDGVELTDLGWFTKDSLPTLPGGGSVARQVIGRFFGI